MGFRYLLGFKGKKKLEILEYRVIEEKSYLKIKEIFEVVLEKEDLSRDGIKKVFENFKDNGNSFYKGKRVKKGEDFPFSENPLAEKIILGELHNFIFNLLRDNAPKILKDTCNEIGGEIFFRAHIIPRLIVDTDWRNQRLQSDFEIPNSIQNYWQKRRTNAIRSKGKYTQDIG